MPRSRGSVRMEWPIPTSRVNDRAAAALAFDLLMLDGEDLRRKPFSERKAALQKILKRTRRGIQYVEHTEGDGRQMFKAVCKLGLEGIVSKKSSRTVLYSAALFGVQIGKIRQSHGANESVGCPKYYQGSAERRPFGLSAAPASARKEGGLP